VDIVSTALLFLSPVGGYFFLQQWERTRYKISLHEGRKLYFQSIAWGLYLTLALFFLLAALRCWVDTPSERSPDILDSWLRPTPQRTLEIALIFSPLAGHFAAKIFNIFTSKRKHFAAALANNEFEWLLSDAISKGSMVLLSMSNGKEYVGFVDTVRDPAEGERRFFSVLPMMSGHRTENLQLNFTTFYDHIYSKIQDDQSAELDHVRLEDFLTVFPVANVRAIRLFDPEAFQAFQRDSSSTHR